jgi:putative ABC transport system permease protein
MFKNYLKVAVRYLAAHKGYSLINILGLAVGITCCMLIMLFVKSEFSYDGFHSKADRLYRVWQHEKYEDQDFINSVTPLPMAAAIQKSYAEVAATCRIYGFNPMVKVHQNSFSESVRMVDSTFFKMFDFRLVEGSLSDPFPNPNTAIITRTLAKKYFGEEKATGKQIEIQIGDEKIPFTISGIAANPPQESSIQFQMLIPYAKAHSVFRPGFFTSWFNVFNETYVLLNEKVNALQLEKKFPAMMKQQLGQDYKEGGFKLHLQPITDIHLNNEIPAGIEPVSNPKYSYILATIGILLLIVACVNFITLSIGRSTTRAMEVGVRKALGAERKQLIGQFWGEALLLTFISVTVALVLSALLIAPFNTLIQRQLSLQFEPSFILFCFFIVLVIALIAGIYPAFILSRFNPVEVLKGKLKMRSNTGWLRQSLIVGQFVASIAMIICTIVIGEQIKYLRNKDLGYNREQVVVVPTNKNRAAGLPMAELFRNELVKHPEVAGVGISLFSFAEGAWINLGFTNDNRVYKSFQYNMVDPEFINTMQIKLVSGRMLSAANGSDLNYAVLVNESFVKEFKLSDPVGKKMPGKFEQRIVGVVKDFNFQSLHNKVDPLVLSLKPDSLVKSSENISYAFSPQPRISVRFRGGAMAANIDLLKQSWKKIAPSQDFEYKFLDETLAAQYQQETRTDIIVKLASALSIFIACMGLFGLATLAVVRRTREIGIRKVMGATVGSIVVIISKEFVKLIIIASIIAFPLAWWFLQDWLKDFAYRVNIGWWIYVAAGTGALLVALCTVGAQAIRAATMNPVRSLRTE